MLVAVTRSAGSPDLRVEDADNLRQFHVVAEDFDADTIGEAISGAAAGEYADGYAWIRRQFIEEAVVVRSADWSKRFEEMIRFAKGKGWTSADGQLIRAHVEWR
ncbi:hypothetical protein ACFU53_03210 [Streptomyces sp. NPDC057474]|uniref:hypothetical protein n=1 Tax=Streptomyces sp. NPDC057474 TaxID=3346144 RepID=UPI0036AC128E